MRDTFSTFHPGINFLLFAAVMGVAVFSMHPVFLATALLTGALYYRRLAGRKARRFLLGMIPVFLISSAVNPLFSHQGMSLLFYMWDGNPVTLESIAYGAASGAMLVGMLLWFACLNAAMTSDKWIYLFGRMLPALSLVLSMTLRFVPRFRRQMGRIADAQKCVGRDVSSGNAAQRAGHGLKLLSILATWALENSVETADSMKSRGYGLRGRTNYSIYRFDTRDRMLAVALCLAFLWTAACLVSGRVRMLCYPLLEMNALTPLSLSAYTAYLALCLTPLLLDLWEDVQWLYFRSKI
ncbi:MAG: energy-coupling factor transporter transmembrane protein EcfT [Lachnospiraceae bacterium]|nr:energy-coupling factor transporter transmembrane protein EcfT [Lachnospiraceae bacterium]